jgi:hypothetical protein
MVFNKRLILLFAVFLVILLSAVVYGDECHGGSVYYDEDSSYYYHDGGSPFFDSIGYDCSVNKDGFFLYNDIVNKLYGINSEKTIDDFKDIIFHNNNFLGNINQENPILFNSLYDYHSTQKGCVDNFRFRTKCNMGSLLTSYIYINNPNNIILTNELCARGNNKVSKAKLNQLILKPDLSLNNNCENCAFTRDNLKNNNLMENFGFGKVSDTGNNAWTCNPNGIILEDVELEPGMYILFGIADCDGEYSGGGNAHENCRYKFGLTREFDEPFWFDNIDEINNNDQGFYMSVERYNQTQLNNMYSKEMANNYSQVCNLLDGDWAEDNPTLEERCCLNSSDEGNQFGAFEDITFCNGDNWVSAGGQACADEVPNSDLDCVWESGAWNQLPLASADNGSDGCCGDDLPGFPITPPPSQITPPELENLCYGFKSCYDLDNDVCQNYGGCYISDVFSSCVSERPPTLNYHNEDDCSGQNYEWLPLVNFGGICRGYKNCNDFDIDVCQNYGGCEVYEEYECWHTRTPAFNYNNEPDCYGQDYEWVPFEDLEGICISLDYIICSEIGDDETTCRSFDGCNWVTFNGDSSCAGDRYPPSAYDSEETCESQEGYDWIPFDYVEVEDPSTEDPMLFNYNDLYYSSISDQTDNQFMCSIEEADFMSLEDFGNEEFSLLTWNWLDAWEEPYIIHNLQLMDQDVQIASNGNNWFMCDGSDNNPLNWPVEDNPDDDFVIDNFEVISSATDKIIDCPYGFYGCACINVSDGGEPFVGQDYGNVGCVKPGLLDSTDFYHPDYPKCLISPYLCNTDFDSDQDSAGEDQICGTSGFGTLGNPPCTDGEELFGPFGEQNEFDPEHPDPHNPDNCPEICQGWPDPDDLNFEFPEGYFSFDTTFISKQFCGNIDAGTCFGGEGSSVENTDSRCDDGEDNDGDCCFGGYNNDHICLGGVDTNNDGKVCGEGDIGVDCLDVDCVNTEPCIDNISENFEYNCSDGLDNDCDCYSGGINPDQSSGCDGDALYYNMMNEGCTFGAYNVDCYDSDCLTSSLCQVEYPGLTYFVSPKNNSIICYERSGDSLFTECCDNYGMNCFNDEYYNDYITEVDGSTRYVGRGVPLYAIRTFDIPEDGLYDDRVIRIFNAPKTIKLNFFNDLSNISQDDYSYYETLEFDLGYVNIDGFNLEFNYLNANSDPEQIVINNKTIINYSSNGVQNYRWHHIKIPLTSNMSYFNNTRIEKLEGGESFIALLDNIYFGVSPEDYEAENYEYRNYKCAGAFGFWIDEFDPDDVVNEGMSCKDIYNNNDGGCTACDWLNVSPDNECVIEDIDNVSAGGFYKNWYDFDPFKYVCNSYLSFGWSGTQCCGDDTNKTMKEFYWDYSGGCWDGYYVMNNQRIGDALYYDQDKNELNRFLFYNKYYICDPDLTIGTIEFNGVELNSNKTYYTLDSPSYDYEIHNNKEFNITSEGVCNIMGNYYCQGDGLWMGDVSGVDDWNHSIVLYDKLDSALNTSGCCPIDYCWTGDTCVHATVYEYDSSKEAFNRIFTGPDHIPFTGVAGTQGYRCVFNDEGSAEWEETIAKYDWFLDTTGYCKDENFCFVREEFNITSEERAELIYDEGIILHGDGCCDVNESSIPYVGEIINDVNADCLFIDSKYYNVSDYNCEIYDCVPNGITMNLVENDLGYVINDYGKYYCDEGNWTSRLTLTSKKMCEWYDCGIDEFSLACDDDLLLNFNQQDLENEISGACAYIKYSDNAFSEDSGVAYNLKQELDDNNMIFSIINTDYGVDVTCNLEEETGLIPCQKKGVGLNELVYYDTETNSLIISSIELDEYNAPFDGFIDSIIELIYGLFYSGFNPDFFVVTGNTVYDKLFMAHKGSLQVLAVQEEKYDENYVNKGIMNKININYSQGFNLQNKIDRALFEDNIIADNELASEFIFNKCHDSGVLLVKEPKVNLYVDEVFNKDDMLWAYLTKTLRLTGESETLDPEFIYTGDTCADCRNDGDCNKGLICENSKCRLTQNQEYCNFNEECSSQLVCEEHICVFPPGIGEDDNLED